MVDEIVCEEEVVCDDDIIDLGNPEFPESRLGICGDRSDLPFADPRLDPKLFLILSTTET